MKKQTAVEWYYQQTIVEAKTNYAELLEQAKAMEKEQMFELWNGGIDCTEEDGKSFDQYYNETYNTDTQ